MNLLYRLSIRLREEGIWRTIKYIIKAWFYSFREFIYDTYMDLRYSGKLLHGNLKTSYKHLGAHDVFHTKYSVLLIIFKMVPIKKDDVLVDVGCGKGRVINYWLSRKLKNRIVGLELDKVVAKHTASHLSKWKNVSIIQGDAIQNLPKDGTIFYIYNSFDKEIFEVLEKTMTTLFNNKPITIVYYNPQSIDVFRNGNWHIRYYNLEKDLGYKKWGRINKYHDLAILKNKVNG